MKIIVIGATHAGTLAAQEILKIHPEAEVTIYERHNNFSFLSCGISLYLDGQVKRLEDMFYASPDDLRELGATVKDSHDVVKIDAKRKTVQVANMTNGEVFTDHYDKLVMTTGSSVIVPPMYGIDESKVLLCKNYQQAIEVYEAAKENKRIAIIGAGYAGTEFAESFAKTGHEVQVFQGRGQILNNYMGRTASTWAVNLLTDFGIDVHLNHHVEAFDDDSITIETNQGDYTADLAVISTGFVPNSELLMGQVKTAQNGAFLIDDYMQTSDPDIYAGGDCAVVRFNPTGKSAYTPLATNAIRQAFLIAHNIFDHNYPYMGTQATSAMKLFGYSLATTGLTLEHAQEKGFNADEVIYRGTWRPEYMPDTDDLSIVLIYDKDNRKILGAQLWSKHEITQSANALSIAIQNNNTIDDLSLVDMLFQPNFDFPFNYLNLVAQMAVEKERQAGNTTPRFTALGHKVDEDDPEVNA
ncbi:FAD-dependent oxidoreductase [Agrilactobacillus yilanensis]|uniref:FAD-dependent oxidoreductase n=1 Tax=Agrilactobacillus yilanensis TaxID=2485997 RepID=A0ABW4J545_9LACO|nr:FAD-dependent oxidoreductase [Agrilactobacillus yilanensis]